MNDIKQEINELRGQIKDLNTGITAALAVSDHRARIKNIIIGVLLALLVMSNGAWFLYERQFETVEETETITIDASQDGDGTNIVGGGDVYNGTESQNN